jgi:hypothetical protein
MTVYPKDYLHRMYLPYFVYSDEIEILSLNYYVKCTVHSIVMCLRSARATAGSGWRLHTMFELRSNFLRSSLINIQHTPTML